MELPPENLKDLPAERIQIEPPKLDWGRNDVEQRFGFKGGRFTSVNNGLTFLAAALLTILFFVGVIYGLNRIEPAQFVAKMFLRGSIPIPIVFLSFWCIAILLVKNRKLALQRRALDLKPFVAGAEVVLIGEQGPESQFEGSEFGFHAI